MHLQLHSARTPSKRQSPPSASPARSIHVPVPGSVCSELSLYLEHTGHVRQDPPDLLSPWNSSCCVCRTVDEAIREMSDRISFLVTVHIGDRVKQILRARHVRPIHACDQGTAPKNQYAVPDNGVYLPHPFIAAGQVHRCRVSRHVQQQFPAPFPTRIPAMLTPKNMHLTGHLI